MAGGGYADIYPGIWHGDLASLGPGVWTGDTMSDGNVAVGTVHIDIVPLPHSQTLPCIKVVIKVFRNANNKANTPETQQKYAKASISKSLSPFLGRPQFLFDSITSVWRMNTAFGHFFAIQTCFLRSA